MKSNPESYFVYYKKKGTENLETEDVVTDMGSHTLGKMV